MKPFALISIFILLFYASLTGKEGNNKTKITLNNWNLSFALPNTAWKPYKTIENSDRSLYIYLRDAVIKDSSEVMASIGVVMETLTEDIDVINYSIYLRSQTSYNILKVYSKNDGIFNLDNAIGYLAENNDSKGVRHTLLILHIVHKNKGIQIIADTTRDTYENLEGEFIEFMKSINVIN